MDSAIPALRIPARSGRRPDLWRNRLAAGRGHRHTLRHRRVRGLQISTGPDQLARPLGERSAVASGHHVLRTHATMKTLLRMCAGLTIAILGQASAEDVAIIVNKANPVDNLTIAQVRKIVLAEQ